MALSNKAKQRLGTLADFMDALPEDANQHFDMSQWAKHPGGFVEHGFGADTVLPMNAPSLCGTTACAMGWACAVPEFYEAGLRLKTAEWGVSDHAFPVYRGKAGDEAAEVFFDINNSQVHSLFFAHRIKTPHEWAKYARQLIDQWSEE